MRQIFISFKLFSISFQFLFSFLLRYFFFKLETALTIYFLFCFFIFIFIDISFIRSTFWYYLFNTFDVVLVLSHIRAKFFRRFWRNSSRTFRILCSRHLKSSTTSSGMMLGYSCSSSERWSSCKFVNENVNNFFFFFISIKV